MEKCIPQKAALTDKNKNHEVSIMMRATRMTSAGFIQKREKGDGKRGGVKRRERVASGGPVLIIQCMTEPGCPRKKKLAK